MATAFAPTPDRAAGLNGLLPPKPRPVDDAGSEATVSLVAAPSRAAEPAERRPHPVTPGIAELAAGPSRDETEPLEGLAKVRNVAVYLPVGLLDRLKRTRRSRDVTYADLLVEAAAAHLPDLERSFQTNAAPATATGMPVRSRRRQAEPGVQVQLRLDGHQVAWLDEQVLRLKAPSRTALVARLLEAHLT